MSSEIRNMAYLNIYLSSTKETDVVRKEIEYQCHQLLDGLVMSSFFNEFTFNIDHLTAKIHSVNYTGVINEMTNFHFKCHHVNLVNKIEKIEKIEIKPFILDIPKPTHLSLDFTKLKVGGLKKQLEEIANVIRPRGISKHHLDQIGMNDFEKGILLYGPPGVGKTTIARELSKILGIHDFTVVNGPELLNKYVGETEANVRSLLQNYSNKLKVVFFDEFDCIAKERSSDSSAGSSVASNVVNQILSIMDGVVEQNNLLIIAATNRIDVIDSALLRPGRFGLILYIGLPEKKEREEIFTIHLAKNIEYDTIKNIGMDWLASKTENYSGAEIKGICKKARELALAEAAPDLCHLDQIDTTLLTLKPAHFEEALNQIKCCFSGNASKAKDLLPLGQGDDNAIDDMLKYCNHIDFSPRIHTYLLTGNHWSFKSTSCRVLCEKVVFDSTFIITDNITNQLDKIDLKTGKSILIILDNLENCCSLLNTSSYNSKTIDYLNKFVGRVVSGKIILIATMRTRASELFNYINPSFEWNHSYNIT